MTDNTHQPQEQPLQSWKEIAAYLKRDVRTVIRWEKTEGLPVHRQVHQARSSVFAYPSELEAWKTSRILKLTMPPPITPWRRAATGVSFALTMLLTLVSMASGPILNPSIASAQGIVNRQVWVGSNVDTMGKTSPDGRFLTFTDWETGDLAIRDLETGENRHVTNTGGWSKSGEWAEGSVASSDGNRIAYTWFSDIMFELRVIGRDGTGPRTLIRDESLDYIQPLAWSTDGAQVFATLIPKGKSPEIVAVSVSDGSRKILKTMHPSIGDWSNMPPVAISTDSRYIAYGIPQADDPAHHNINFLSADGSRDNLLVDHPADDLPLAWTSDGKTLLFSSDRTGQYCLWTIDVLDGKPQGSARMLKPGTGELTALGLSPKGSFYYGIRTGVRELYTATIDFKNGKVIEPPKPVTQLFTGRNNSPDWSPDGSQLAYASVRGRRDISGFVNNADTIVVRSVQTGQEREIKPELASMRAHLGMRWSSDGHSFIIKGSDRKGNDGVFQVDAQTGKVKAILQGKMADGVYRVTSTADSKVLAFTRNDPSGGKFNSVRLRNLETGQEREIVGGPNYGFIGFSISPDGSLLAFTGREPGGASVLRVISTQGGKPRELLRLQEPEFIGAGMGGIAWTPDGRYIVFPKTGQQRKTQIGVIPVEGGEPTYLDLQLEWAMGLRIHPDGRHIVFGSGMPSQEVWVMENFLPALRAAK